jgi:hypothetical protein
VFLDGWFIFLGLVRLPTTSTTTAVTHVLLLQKSRLETG